MRSQKKNINKIHFYSGITLSLFIGLHLFNHIISINGADAHIVLMEKLRVLYRNPIIETLLMIAVVTQIISGAKLFFLTKKRKNGFYKKLQIWSGLYMAIFLLIHVSVVMVGRFYLAVDTNIYFGAAGLNIFPLNLFFIPYYGLAIMSFFAHVSAIHSEKMTRSMVGLSVNQQSNLILIFGMLMTLTIIYGLTNGFSGMPIPEDYYDLMHISQ